MSDLLSIDPGSSYIKAGTDQQTVRFPAVALPTDTRTGDTITVDGRSYVVGEQALYAQGRPRHEPHPGAEYHGSQLQHVLICEALRRLDISGSTPTVLVGLPYFLRHDAESRQRVQGKMERFEWADADGQHTVIPTDVNIVPQGGGALWGWVSGHRNDGLGLVCAIDIGGHTTDVFTLDVGENIAADQEVQGSSGSIGTNVHAFYQRLSDRLKRMPGTGLHEKTFSYFSLMDTIERGRRDLRYNGKKVDITAPIRETCIEFTEDLLRAAQDTVGDRWSELDKILLTGGGAALVDLDILGDNRVVNLDANSNVTGQLSFYLEAQAGEAA